MVDDYPPSYGERSLMRVQMERAQIAIDRMEWQSKKDLARASGKQAGRKDQFDAAFIGSRSEWLDYTAMNTAFGEADTEIADEDLEDLIPFLEGEQLEAAKSRLRYLQFLETEEGVLYIEKNRLSKERHGQTIVDGSTIWVGSPLSGF
jgi:hypothetical protein